MPKGMEMGRPSAVGIVQLAVPVAGTWPFPLWEQCMFPLYCILYTIVFWGRKSTHVSKLGCRLDWWRPWQGICGKSQEVSLTYQ